MELALAAEARAENSYEHYRALAQSRTIAFCCSPRHADYMGAFYRSKGLRVAVVNSGAHSDGRSDSLRRLSEGELDILCCVDMFNEGLDVPAIDTVIMLRPTESRVLPRRPAQTGNTRTVTITSWVLPPAHARPGAGNTRAVTITS